MMRKSRHTAGTVGILILLAGRSRFIARAARPIRREEVVIGGNSWAAMATKKNEPPHRPDRANSMAQSARVTERLKVLNVICQP